MSRTQLSFVLVAALFATQLLLSASACPDLSKYRSQHILNGFDAAKLTGMWYESAYIDIAQFGATCPTLNGTYTATDGKINMAFSVKYGPLPFTIQELYTPNNNGTGLYTKNAQMPGTFLGQGGYMSEL